MLRFYFVSIYSFMRNGLAVGWHFFSVPQRLTLLIGDQCGLRRVCLSILFPVRSY